MKNKKDGFTLIEMIVTMAIILVLCLLIYPAIITGIKKGEETQCIGQMKQLGVAMTMHLHDYGAYPKSARYAPPGEGGSIVDSLPRYIDNPEVFICPASDVSFKQKQLSYIYNTGARDEIGAAQWLLVDARLPDSANPHLGDRAAVLWSDGHAKLEEVILPE